MAAKCIPIGFRFLPTAEELITHYLAEKIRGNPLTAEELITHYLAEKIRGNPLPSDCIVEKQLYGEDADPWKVFSSDDDQWLISEETTDRRMGIYVSTELTKKDSKRISRTAGCGFWRAQTREEAVKNSGGDQIGSVRMLSLEGRSGVKIDHDQYGHWTMYEFSCTDNDHDDLNKNYCVVCRITTTWNNAKEYRRATVEEGEDIAEISIPIGYRFSPTDEELVTHFLAKKLEEKPLPCNCIVEKQVYGENADPWKIFSEQDQWVSEKTTDDDVNKGTKTVKKAIYVFTELTKLGSKRISRTAGCGVWRRQRSSSSTPVKNSRGDQIGSKNMLSFHGVKSGFKIDENRYGQLIMHEFSCVTHDNYVVCKITATWNNNVMKEHGNKRAAAEDHDGILMNKKQKTASDDVVTVQEDSSIALDDEYNVDELMNFGYEVQQLLPGPDDHNGPI